MVEPTNEWVKVTYVTLEQLAAIPDTALQSWHEIEYETPNQKINELRRLNGCNYPHTGL
jgi:hypothetical protein